VKKVTLILISVVTILFLTNLVALDVGWLKARRGQDLAKGSAKVVSDSVLLPTPLVESCGLACQQLIDDKISQAISTVSGKETIRETKVVEKSTSQPQVVYIPLGGGGSTTNRDWADVGNAEVYLNINDYPNLDRAYFEGFIKVKHGNGKVYARLYDVTHSIGVQGGEISSDSETFTLVESGSLNFWQGKNLYRVQVKSLNGYEAFFDSGRIRIILN